MPELHLDAVISPREFRVNDDYEGNLLVKIALAVTGKKEMHLWQYDIYSRKFEHGILMLELTVEEDKAVRGAYLEAVGLMRNRFLEMVREFVPVLEKVEE
jgi:hypothetical protein